MRSIVTPFALSLAVFASSCAVQLQGQLRNPLDAAMFRECSERERVSFASVVGSCRPIVIVGDVYDYLGLPVLTTELERSGLMVLRGYPDSGDYLALDLRYVGTGFGSNQLVRLEIRNRAGDLLYWREALVSERWFLPKAVNRVTHAVCQVKPWPCGRGQ